MCGVQDQCFTGSPSKQRLKIGIMFTALGQGGLAEYKKRFIYHVAERCVIQTQVT